MTELPFPRPCIAGPGWWVEMAMRAEDAGCDRFSADWYRSIRDQYRRRFPSADATSLDNLDMFVERAEQREVACPPTAVQKWSTER